MMAGANGTISAIKRHTPSTAAATGLTLGSLVVGLLAVDKTNMAPWPSKAQAEEVSKEVEALKAHAASQDKKLDGIDDKVQGLEAKTDERFDEIQNEQARQGAEQARQGARTDRVIELQNRVLDKLDTLTPHEHDDAR